MKHLNEWAEHEVITLTFDEFRTKVKYLFLQLRPMVESFLQELEPEMRLSMSSQIRRLNLMDVPNKIYSNTFATTESLSLWLFKSLGLAAVGEAAELLNSVIFRPMSDVLRNDKNMRPLHSVPRVWLCVCCIILTFLVPN